MYKKFDFDRVAVYDLEIGPNYFIACFKNPVTGSKKSFVIHKDRDDREELYKFINKIRSYWFVGFNNLEFDGQLIETFLDNFHSPVLLDILNRRTRELIEDKTDWNKWEILIPEWKLSTKQLDLYKMSHFDNKAKRSSLKSLQINMEWHNVLDMPYHHSMPLTIDQVLEIEDYCWNDVESTEHYYNLKKEDIQLRIDIGLQYNLHLLNKPNASIGTDIAKNEYCKLSGRHFLEFKNSRDTNIEFKFSEIISDKVQFSSRELQKVLSDIKMYSPTTLALAKEYTFVYKGLKTVMALGGLHSSNKPFVYSETNTHDIIDIDFGSYYPGLMISLGIYPPHLGQEFIKLIELLRDRRLVAKKNKDKVTNESLKLSINSIYGKMGDKNSWLQSMRSLYKVTINGQLLLIMLCEKCTDLGVDCIYQNTDGATFIVPKGLREKFTKVVEDFGTYVDIPVEFTDYKKCVITSVNDYVIEKTNEEIKRKGDFIVDYDYHQNNSYRIIPIALENYFIKGIPIETTIKSHTKILDFCAKIKGTSDWHFEVRKCEDGEIVKDTLQKNNRYIISTKGYVLYKMNKEGKTQFVEAHPIKGRSWKVTILNKIESLEAKDYNLDFSYYIRECNKFLYQLEPNQIAMF